MKSWFYGEQLDFLIRQSEDTLLQTGERKFLSFLWRMLHHHKVIYLRMLLAALMFHDCKQSVCRVGEPKEIALRHVEKESRRIHSLPIDNIPCRSHSWTYTN